MSAVQRTAESNTGSGLSGLRMSNAEFLALGELSERYELVDGVVVMSPRPTTLHQTLLRIMQRQFEAFIDAHPGWRYFPDVDVELGTGVVYAPDLVCYAPGRVAGFPTSLAVAPDLVVEILSPSNKAFDLTTKKDDYERFGVGEYWAVDPTPMGGGSGGVPLRVRCYRRQAAASGPALLIEATVSGDSLASSALPGFTLDLRPLRALDGFRG